MKKTGIILLASAALLLSSCGAKYTLKGSDDTVLTLGGSSFSIVDEGDIITTVKGKAEKTDKENQYKLTVTTETYQLEKGETLSKAEEVLLSLTWSSEEIVDLKDGKKVTKKLNEDKYYTYTVNIDKEAKTYTVALFK